MLYPFPSPEAAWKVIGSSQLKVQLCLLLHLPRLASTPLTGLCNSKEEFSKPGLVKTLRLTGLPIQPHCLLLQTSASSYQTPAPSGIHKNLPKASPYLTDFHWPEEPMRAAQSALSLVLCPSCLEMMGERFQLLQTSLIFSFRNLNALLGFLLSASLSV